MKIRNYEKGDIYKIVQNHIEDMMMRYMREEILLENDSFTGLDDGGKVIGCAGLIKIWDGVCEAWIALDETSKQEHKFAILRLLKDVLDGLPKSIIRVHGFVNEKLPNQDHFMSLLGFEKEAVLTHFFPNRKDCIVWRKLGGSL